MKKRARSDEAKYIKKTVILDVAKELFSQYGYQGTTIGMITDKANLSPAAFYTYFKSKIDIYRNLTSMGINILKDMITEAISNPNMCPTEKIKSIATAYFDYFKSHREYYNITEILHLGLGDFFSNNEMVEDLDRQAIDILKIIKNIIEEGIETNEFENINTWKTAVALWGIIDGIMLLEVKKTIDYTKEPIENIVEHSMQLILNGLLIRK